SLSPGSSQMMLGVLPSLVGWSCRWLLLQPASTNKALILAARCEMPAGASCALSRTTGLSNAANWTFCAQEPPLSATMQTARALRHALRANLHCLGNNFAALERRIDPGNRWIVREDREPPFRHGFRVVTLAVLDGFQREQVVGHHPRHVHVP